MDLRGKNQIDKVLQPDIDLEIDNQDDYYIVRETITNQMRPKLKDFLYVASDTSY
jgi:hypothetical protein